MSRTDGPGRHLGRRRSGRFLLRVVLLAVVLAVVAVAVVSRVVPRPSPVRGDVVAERPRLWVIGDSISYGATSATGLDPGGYRGRLGGDLAAAGHPVTFVGTSTTNPPRAAPGIDLAAVRHDGWPGARVDEVYRSLTGDTRFDGGHWLDGTDVRAPVDADVVVLMIGTNDIGQGYDPEASYRGPFDARDARQRAEFVGHLSDRLGGLVASLSSRLPEARLVVCTIAPIQQRDVAPAATAYSRAIRRALSGTGETSDGPPVVLADVHRALQRLARPIGPDGIHPTPIGYRTIARTITPAVVQALTESSLEPR